MTGYVLVLVVLILGGVIATMGDRIGTRVGKARLSLFNLRPKKTAVLVTILTGILISGSTLLLLFLTDRQLRTGLFRLEKIQEQLRTSQREQGQAEAELQAAQQEKQQAELELSAAQTRQTQAQQRLDQINRSLEQSQRRQQQISTQLKQTEQSLDESQRRFQQVNERLQAVSRQEETLRGTLNQLTTERQRLAVELTQAQERLGALEDQRSQLETEIRSLRISQGQLSLALRQGAVAIQAGQILAIRVVNQVTNPTAARQAVDQVLLQANQEVQRLITTVPGRPPGNRNGLVIQITQTEVNRLVERIADGRNYVIRIQSAANYLVGEPKARIYADADLNRAVFPANEVVAAVTVNLTANIDNSLLLERLDFLLTASNFRARQAGVLADPLTGTVGQFSPASVAQFIEDLRQYRGNVDILAVTSRTIYTAGPLSLELVVVQNNQVLLRIGIE